MGTPVQVEDAASWQMDVVVEGTVAAEGTEPTVDVVYSRVHGRYTVTGTLPTGASETFDLPVLQPDRRFLARLVTALRAEGVRIRYAALAPPPKVIAVHVRGGPQPRPSAPGTSQYPKSQGHARVRSHPPPPEAS